MDSNALRRALEEAGLTEYQVAAYLATLELGSGPVVSVAKRASVPTAQIYDAVRRLESEGYVETIEREKLYVRANRPDLILEHLRDKSDLFSDAANEIQERWEEPDPEEYRVNVLKRRESVVNRARAALADATISVELAVTPEQFGELMPSIQAAADRGIVTRVTFSGEPSSIEFEELGVIEVRWRSLPTPFLVIVDRRRAFFAPADPHGEPYGVVINDDILTLVLHWFHLTLMWLPCEQRYVDSSAPPTYLSIEEFIQDIAPLWHEGVRFRVIVRGQEIDTGAYTEIRGDLKSIVVGNRTGLPRNPTITQLSGVASIVVTTDQADHSVGGWGAFVEDIETQVIIVEDMTFPSPFA